VVILFLAALTFVTLDRAIAAVPSRAAGTLEQQPFVARVVAVSAIVAVFATRMVIERSTW
jgi:hypothetical protein